MKKQTMRRLDSPRHMPSVFARDERGQGMLFAAATIGLLIAFVALVANLGRVIERRTRMQLAADAAVYSGAAVQADAISAIGWINSMMAQTHYAALKYAVDLNIASVAATYELRVNPELHDTGPAVTSLKSAFALADAGLPMAKEWMLKLSRTENCLAILASRLTEEEMIAVAGRTGAERFSFYPSTRLFPHHGGRIRYLIERLEDGWLIRKINDDDNLSDSMLYVKLDGDTWTIQHSANGVVIREVKIQHSPDKPDEWYIDVSQPPGNLLQSIQVTRIGDDEWAINDRIKGVSVDFQKVDMDGDGTKEGMKVSANGVTETFKRDKSGDLLKWDSTIRDYVRMNSPTLNVGGVSINLNGSNNIALQDPSGKRYGSISIGDPSTVRIGGASITLSNPPRISTRMGPYVWVEITGFNPGDLAIHVGGYTIGVSDATGAWRKYYDPNQEMWVRDSLTEVTPTSPDALQAWEFDREYMGALLREEPNLPLPGSPPGAKPSTRFLIHAFPNGMRPSWAQWFDPDPSTGGRPYRQYDHPDMVRYDRPDGSWVMRLTEEAEQKLNSAYSDYYYIGNGICNHCGGKGGDWQGGSWHMCPVCEGKVWSSRGDTTSVRIFPSDIFGGPGARSTLADLLNTRTTQLTDRMTVHMFNTGNDQTVNDESTMNAPFARMPLVLTDEFFKYGINVGVWRAKDEPMLFPASRQPDWGVAALSSARVGIADGRDYVWAFTDIDARNYWCDYSLANLYTTNVMPALYAMKRQVQEMDLEHDRFFSAAVSTVSETPSSYLLDAIINGGGAGNNVTWVQTFEGKRDWTVTQPLRTMHDRSGNRFDYRDGDVEKVLEH